MKNDVENLLPEDFVSNEAKIKEQQLEEYRKILTEILSGASSFGGRSLFVAAHYTGNGLIMSMLGDDAAAASSITTTGVAVIAGITTGLSAATGIRLAKALGKEDMKAASAIIRTSWVMSVLLGSVAAGVFLSSRALLPFVLNKGVANAAANFFSTYAIAAIPELLTWNNGQTVFQIEKNSQVPFLTTATYRLPALALSYYFAKILNMGPLGVGLGAAVSGWANVLVFQPWFSKKIYQDLGIYNPHIEDFSVYVKDFFESGWPIALQRTSEWLNLFVIAEISGAWSTDALLAEQVSLLLLVASGLMTQGVGQADMMMMTRDRTAMKKALSDFENTGDRKHLEAVRKLNNKNYKHFFISNSAGIAFSLLLAAAIYLGKDQVIDLYAPEGTSESTLALATTLLWINDISLPFDASRNITAGILRGWNDLLYPTLLSLFLMTAVGIPVGAGIGEAMKKSVIPFFIVRIVALILSAGVSIQRFFVHCQEDKKICDLAETQQNLIDGLSNYSSIARTNNLFQSKTLSDLASKYEMNIENVSGGGDRLFESLAVALNDGRDYVKIKRLIAQHIRDNNSWLIMCFRVLLNMANKLTICWLLKWQEPWNGNQYSAFN